MKCSIPPPPPTLSNGNNRTADHGSSHSKYQKNSTIILRRALDRGKQNQHTQKITQSFPALPHARLGHADSRFLWDFEESWPVEDLAACRHRVLGVKRRVSHETLEHDHTQRPPVAFLAVALLLQHLQKGGPETAARVLSDVVPPRGNRHQQAPTGTNRKEGTGWRQRHIVRDHSKKKHSVWCCPINCRHGNGHATFNEPRLPLLVTGSLISTLHFW